MTTRDTPTLLMREVRFENGTGIGDDGQTGSVVALEFTGAVLVDGERLENSTMKIAIVATSYPALVNSLVFHGVNSDLIPRSPRLPCPVDYMHRHVEGVDGWGWFVVQCARHFGHPGIHASGRGYPLVWSDRQAARAMESFDEHSAWYLQNRALYS